MKKRKRHTETMWCGLIGNYFKFATVSRSKHDTEILTRMAYGPNAEVVRVRVSELPPIRSKGGKR